MLFNFIMNKSDVMNSHIYPCTSILIFFVISFSIMPFDVYFVHDGAFRFSIFKIMRNQNLNCHDDRERGPPYI